MAVTGGRPTGDSDRDSETGKATGPTTGRHLLSVADLGADGIDEVMRLADTFVEVGRRPIPKVPALRGKTVVSTFFEDSTRTRLSFETAAKRLSADVMTFTGSSSSLNKGESLRDTVLTIEAMGVDAFVVRHACAGVPAAGGALVGGGGRAPRSSTPATGRTSTPPRRSSTASRSAGSESGASVTVPGGRWCSRACT